MSVYRRNDCRLCGSEDLELVLPLTPTPLGDSYVQDADLAKALPEYPIELFLCRACGYAHLRDVVSPDEIYPDYLYVTESSLGLQSHFEEYAEESLEKTRLGCQAFVVDIGSNDGSLLRSYQMRGCRVLGIDPARAIAEKATESGVKTLADYFSADLANAISNDEGKADIITVNNCLANLDDLDEILAGIDNLLAPDGVFIIEFAYLRDLVEGMIFDYIYHEHLSYFHVKSFARFLEKHGFEPIDLTRTSSKGGSVRLYTKRKGSDRPVDGSIARAISEEDSLGLENPATYRKFAESILERREAGRECLQRWKNEGREVWGYGASVTSTTLIYHFGLGDFLTGLIDDNPAKIGTFSPGLGLPVLSLPEFANRADDDDAGVLILAWRYSEPILLKLRESGLEKNPVAIPLPEFTEPTP